MEETDIKALLRELPECGAIVTTGQKATDVVCRQFGTVAPTVGAYADVTFGGRHLRLYRMPSSSRAYPMRLEQKAAFYKEMFDREVSEILKLKR